MRTREARRRSGQLCGQLRTACCLDSAPESEAASAASCTQMPAGGERGASALSTERGRGGAYRGVRAGGVSLIRSVLIRFRRAFLADGLFGARHPRPSQPPLEGRAVTPRRDNAQYSLQKEILSWGSEVGSQKGIRTITLLLKHYRPK